VQQNRTKLLHVIIIIIIRPHRSTMDIDAGYCYKLSSVVCRSVTVVSSAKTAQTSKWLNISSYNQHHMVAYNQFSDIKVLSEIPIRSPQITASNMH